MPLSLYWIGRLRRRFHFARTGAERTPIPTVRPRFAPCGVMPACFCGLSVDFGRFLCFETANQMADVTTSGIVTWPKYFCSRTHLVLPTTKSSKSVRTECGLIWTCFLVELQI